MLENVLTFRFMKQCKFVPVALENNVLTLAMTDPLDSATLDSVRQATGYQLKPLLGAESEIMDVLEKFYGSAASTFGRIIEGIDEGNIENLSDEIEDIEQLKDLASEAPVIRLVNLLISKAIESRASDIHIEPFEKDLKVRYRIDGILHDVESPPKKLKAALISRVKIMSKLNIAERRLPQDGRIKLKVLGKDIDLRVSTLPTLYGESVVMRILDKSNTSLYDIRRLGFPEDSLQRIRIADPPSARNFPGDGADRQRQDHHALQRAEHHQSAGQEDHHDRGSDRIPDGRRQPDPRQSADRIDLRVRACATSCGRIRMSSWSAKFATWKRPKSPFAPR